MSNFKDKLNTYLLLLTLAAVVAAGLLDYGLGTPSISATSQSEGQTPTELHASLNAPFGSIEYGALNASPSGFVLYLGPDRIQEAAPDFIPHLNQRYLLDCHNYGDTTQPEHVITCLNHLGWQIDQYVATGNLHRYVLKRPSR